MSQLLEDFERMAADLGWHQMTVPGVDAPVPVVARDLGPQKLDGEDAAYGGERAHQAVQFLQFGAVVVEFAADVINSGRVVYI